MSTAETPLSEAEALFYEGNRCWAAGDMAGAEECFRAAIRCSPDLAEAHANLGLLLDQSARKVEAETHYRSSLAANPECGQTQLNLAVMLAEQKRFADAEDAYARALELLPDSAAAWSNFGVLQACRKYEETAEESYRRALTLDPDYALARFNLSYLLLRQGRFDEGWAALEARDWYAPLEAYFDCPRWQGEDLGGKSLLIGIEAGYGDMIQFSRYAALLKARGAARVTLLCHPPLKTLFMSLAAVDSVIACDEPIPASGWDVWTPPLSLPCHCRTRLESIPADLPYLRADPEKAAYWRSFLGADAVSADLRVGLVWKGNPRFENDADRSLSSLALLAPLWTVAGVRFYSLQKGAGEHEAATSSAPAGLPLTDVAPAIADFADTAAIVDNLDLVICVDTAIAHLAGALGKPCWLLLPDYKTDWRWLAGRSDSPWYPGVLRLFRQPAGGDWPPLIDAVRVALHERVADALQRSSNNS
jgi:Tfp pilus assembly protein PilF